MSRADNPDAYAQKVLTRSWLTERGRGWWRRERSAAEPPDTEWVPPDSLRTAAASTQH